MVQLGNTLISMATRMIADMWLLTPSETMESSRTRSRQLPSSKAECRAALAAPELTRWQRSGGVRRSGIMVTRSLFGFEARAKGSWCGRRDLNPHGPCGPTDFLTPTAFAAPAFAAGFGVWTIPSPCPDLVPGVRCCPSSLYTFPAVSGRAWLGIAMLQGSPTLSSSASPVSRRALKFVA